MTPRPQRAALVTQVPSLPPSPLSSAPSAVLGARVFRVRGRAPCVKLESILTPKEAARALRAPLVQLRLWRVPLRAQNVPLDSSRVAPVSSSASCATEESFRLKKPARRAYSVPEDILHLKALRRVQARRTRATSSTKGRRPSARRIVCVAEHL
jgi:hypothetical protein